MHNLGETRSSYQRTHLLQTPDTFVRTTLPGMKGASAIIHAAPQIGASFTQYTAELEAAGVLGPTTGQRFVYVLEGALKVEGDAGSKALAQDGYVYLPQEAAHTITATEKTKAVVIEKKYAALADIPWGTEIFGDAATIASNPLMGDADLQVQILLPEGLEYDFAINVMSYEPGASLSMVEIHVMEHGLLMLEGGGIYRLGDSWYPVTAGDFIWMAPYCPQWFGAIGKTRAKYLIYKDSNRHPLGEV
jgi:(S)-ureidoglycine aminohydrolase